MVQTAAVIGIIASGLSTGRMGLSGKVLWTSAQIVGLALQG